MTASVRTARPAIAGSALACVAALTAACGSVTPGATSTPAKTVTVTVTPHTGTTSPAPATNTPAATGGGAAPCPTRSLGLKPGLAQGAAGSTYQVIDFTNTSSVTCTLYGYPGVSAGNGQPLTQVGLAAAETPTPPRELVTLAPGAVANAVLRIVDAGNYPAAKCSMTPTALLRIYPPNQTAPVYLHYHTQMCAKPVQTLSVSVVQPGSGGNA
jgi:hypothetical protein